MNGFANTLLSFILSWIRTLISNIWAVINSEDGGLLYQFLAKNWKTILLIMLITGVLIDRVVYLFRWRPYYVWQSRREYRRRKKKKTSSPVVQEPVWQPEPAAEAYQPPVQAAPTMAYAPIRQNSTAAAPAYTQVYAPVQDSEPLFDEPVAQWEEPADWQQETRVSFGQPRPEPLTYYHDMQAGFAPAIPPEQLYAPRVQLQESVAPVHPGLNEEAFRQSFGLEEAEPPSMPMMRAPAFRPFTARDEIAELPKPQSALSRFAQRARTLVSAEDEDHPLTFRDLQTTVDVSKAFHEPVYPQSMKQDD